MVLQEAPAIRLSGAHLAYRGELLFDRLDLTLAAGRTTCLLGPSGVGKTSLLRLIAGLTEGAEGEVTDGAARSLAGRVAYMAQQDLLLPWLSALENVILGDRLRGRPPRRQQARELLRAVGLSDRQGERPGALSGGMRQRVALARTLFEERPVVLMDEPFSSLDALTRLDLQELAARLLAGRTVLLVTHDPLEALRIGDRVLVMAGRPARIETVEPPPGRPPRAPHEPELLTRQAALLARLAVARRAQ